MEIDGNSLISAYDSYVKQMAGNASGTSSINTSKNYANSSDEELMDACKQFEAYFLEQCFKEMLKTVKTDESSSGSMSTLVDYYKDSMVQQVSEQATEKEGLGLAQSLYEQMKRNYGL